MPLTDTGRNLMAGLLVGTSSNTFTNSTSYIGVGDSSAGFLSAQTDLQGTKLRKNVDGGFPTITNNVLTFQATFGTGQANFAWNEWGIFNASSSGTMLNRKVENLGTKTSAQSWQITCVLTVNNP